MLLDVKIRPDTWVTFGTPLLIRRFENSALNGALHRILLERQARHPANAAGAEGPNIGGWRSEADLLEWPEPEIATLKAMIHEGASQVMKLATGGRNVQIRADFDLVGWGHVDRSGSYTAAHSHPGHHWSGIYFIDPGRPDADQPLSGVIEFQDPRLPGSATLIPGFDFGHPGRITPEPGLMLIFPSWQMHMVHPFFGEGERTSVGFNLALHEFTLLS